MAQIAGYSELLVVEDKQGRDNETDQWPRYVPGPWTREYIQHANLRSGF